MLLGYVVGGFLALLFIGVIFQATPVVARKDPPKKTIQELYEQRDELDRRIETEERALAALQLAEHSPFRATEDAVEVRPLKSA